MADRAAIVAELNRLEDANGEITPRIVVDAARDPESPLHGQFEWDDGVAAEAYRLDQARTVLRIRIEVGPTKHNDARVSVSVSAYTRHPEAEPNEQRYVSTATLRGDAELRHGALVQELSRVASHLRRARDLARFFDAEDVVAEIEQQVREFRAEIAQQPPL